MSEQPYKARVMRSFALTPEEAMKFKELAQKRQITQTELFRRLMAQAEKETKTQENSTV